ncbi:MAG: hypothetical protein CMH83_19325 [Nocardioides sp.]|nr:hypothetical protein [Nocardioides sp.]
MGHAPYQCRSSQIWQCPPPDVDVLTNDYTFDMLERMTCPNLPTQVSTQPATMRRMAKPPMVQKTYRVPKTLYEAAMQKAEEREENISDVIREALERYVRKP